MVDQYGVRLEQDRRLRKFVEHEASRLPGETPMLPEMVRGLDLADQSGQLWCRKGVVVSPPEAEKLVGQGSALWIVVEGDWPPHVVPAEKVPILFEILKTRWLDCAPNWRNESINELEPDCMIETLTKKRGKTKPPKRKKGAPREPVVLLVSTSND